MERDPAVSSVHGNLLMVIIVVIIAAILLLYVMGMMDGLGGTRTLAPPLIQITAVFHTKQGVMNLASQVAIENKYTVEYPNKDLQAEFLCNGKQLLANIFTLHGPGFIPTHHFGVSTIGGAGCSGDYFSPGEKILIDLKNGYYRPGDTVELRIYQRSDDTSVAPITGLITDDSYMEEWKKKNLYSERKGYRLISQHRFAA